MSRKAKKRVAIIVPPGPGSDEFLRRLEGVKSDQEYVALLAEAKEKGWVEILGATELDPKEACLWSRSSSGKRLGLFMILSWRQRRRRVRKYRLEDLCGLSWASKRRMGGCKVADGSLRLRA